MVQPGITPKLSLTPGRIRTGAPRLGEHNSSVYTELLELTPDECRRLHDDGVI